MIVEATITETFVTRVQFTVSDGTELEEIEQQLYSDVNDGSDFSGYDYSTRDYTVDVEIDNITN